MAGLVKRGHEASYPSEVPAAGWRDILLRVWDEIGRDNISMIAAGVAFYGLLAVFPAITAVVSIWGLVADPAQVQQQFAMVREIVPAEAWDLLNAQLLSVASSSATRLGWGVALGILVALWSAGAGVRGLIIALNIAYEEEEKRGLIKFYALAFLFTLGLIAAAFLSLVVIVALPVVLHFLPLDNIGDALIRLLTWVVLGPW
jgi:membrane protein